MPEAAKDFGLSIAATKRIFATHTLYTGEELLQQIDDGTAGAMGGGAAGNVGAVSRASAHVHVDWDVKPETQWGIGIIFHFLFPGEKMQKMFSRSRGTKHFTAQEQEAHQQNKRPGKGYVRSVRIAPATPIPNSPTGPAG